MAASPSATAAATVAQTIAGPSSNISRYPKLDGVLYHFYSKTSAVITTTRLTHFEHTEPLTGSSTNSFRHHHHHNHHHQAAVRRTSSESQQQTSASVQAGLSRTGSERRPSKWFALEIDDHDVFREEVRLWRNVSMLIPPSVLDGPPSSSSSTPPSQGTPYVPAMILDVILDTSSLTSKHVLMIEEIDDDGRTRRRVRVDGRDTDPSSRRSSSAGKAREQSQAPYEDEPLDAQRQSIVLESWRLDFSVHTPTEPPDLPALYKHATAHFREVYGTVSDLPACTLHRRLKGAWQSFLERQRERRDSTDDAEEADEDDASSATLLKIGVRLAIGESSKQEDGSNVALREPLGSMIHEQRPVDRVTRSIKFPSILSPIGSLTFSVEHRNNVDFYVEDWHVIKSLQEIALDEDYFKPTVVKHLQRRTSTQRNPLSSSPASQPSPLSERPRSLLSVTSTQQRPESALSAPSDASGGIPTATGNPAVTENVVSTRTIPSGNANLTSVLGSVGTASGRPVAGLSSLRANPSIAGYSASPSALPLTSTISSSGTSSPSLPGALTSDAAFLTHARRASSSTSERRLRTLNSVNVNNDRENSPSPVTSNSPLASRPILTRAAATAFPRSGSYSPSSPSPLAQQLYAQQNLALNNANSQSGRFSSSPSLRGGFASSISPSLRSVFQTYTPSQSQTSISSLSRTPPRSLLEGPSAQTPSSLGLRDVDTSTSNPQHMPSTSLTSSSRQPTVGPQMIKRYSSTFGYRQGRHGDSLGSEGGSSGGGGIGGGEMRVGGSGVGTSGSMGAGMYSKSWQARIEHRQMITARSMGREESSLYPASSPASIRAPTYAGSFGQEEDLDDFVRMLELKPSLLIRDEEQKDRMDLKSDKPSNESSTDTTHEGHNDQYRAGFAGSRDDAEKAMTSPHINEHPLTRVESNQSTSSVLNFPRNYGLNRTQVDDMLSRMQSSMRDFGTSIGTNRSSPASGGAATSSSGGAHSQAEHSPSSHPSGRSPAMTRSPLSRGTFTAPSRPGVPMQAILSGDGIGAASTGTSPARRPLPVSEEVNQSIASYRAQDDDVGHRDIDADRTTRRHLVPQGEIDEEDDGSGARESREEGRMSRSHPGRNTSRGSLELYGGASHSYDPLDDEAAGRLELTADESSTTLSGGGGGGVGGGDVGQQGIAALQSHGHAARSTSVGPLMNADEEARQRQTDFELARNFTQTVSIRGGAGNSIRPPAGRSSMSPWRLRGYHHPTTAAPTSSHPDSLSHNHLHVHRGRHTPHLHGHAQQQQHTAHGTRSGPSSAGPASRAASPSMDD